MAPPATSAITMAFASLSPSFDVAGQPGDKAATGISIAAAKRASGLPPTPPNSISPNLPPHLTRVGVASPPPIQIDRDLELQDAVDHAARQDQPQVPLSRGALSGLGAVDAITPSMLARKHLPNIILGHGPIAIRHVMACLTQAVPGFSRIPSAKARRLVVAALENRSGGGLDGSIEFEKVGWGRWDAHVKGEKSTNEFGTSFQDGKMSPPASEAGSYAASHAELGFPIPKTRQRRDDRDVYGRSWAGSDMPTYDEELEDMSMDEHEADKMSLDGSDVLDDDAHSDDSLSDSAGDETEEEDWTSVGVDALRKASLSTAANSSVRRNYNLLCIPSSVYNSRRLSHAGTGPRRQSVLSKSLPLASRQASQRPQRGPSHQPPATYINGFNNIGSMDLDQTAQEREAIEALLHMGSR